MSIYMGFQRTELHSEMMRHYLGLAQNSAGSSALMRTESPACQQDTAQHRSPVSPLVTATPSRAPFFLTVSVPASESSSRRSTSPSS